MNTTKTAAVNALLDLLVTVPDDCLADVALITSAFHSMKPKQFTAFTALLTKDPAFVSAAKSYRTAAAAYGSAPEVSTRRLVRCISSALAEQ